MNTTKIYTNTYETLLQYVEGLLGLVFPEVCISCKTELLDGENELCTACQVLLPFTNFEQMQGNPAKERMNTFLDINDVASLLYYSNMGISKQILNALKYKRKPGLGVMLGELIGRRIKATSYADVDALIPVPLTKNKEQRRGYNQSYLICEGISQQLGIPVLNILSRIEAKSSQTTLNRYERWLNTKDDFELNSYEGIQEMRVLLIDDVLTTGATLAACHEILKPSVSEIKILTLALA